MMTVDELAVVLLELAHTPRQQEWIAEWRPELVDSLSIVIQWALGRIPPEIARRLPKERSLEELSSAALLLVKRVCFSVDSTHYQVFGLTSETMTQEALRARYRALIRLTHPDVGVGGLPKDAAGLVNRAYAVLGDERARKAYDDQLAAGAQERRQRADQPSDPPEFFVDDARAGRGERHQSAAFRASMGERILARWVMANARWSRQLRVSLIGMIIMVPLALFVFWNLSDTWEKNTIVALAPDRDVFAGAVEPVVHSGPGQASHEPMKSRPQTGARMRGLTPVEPDARVSMPETAWVGSSAELMRAAAGTDGLRQQAAGDAEPHLASAGSVVDGWADQGEWKNQGQVGPDSLFADASGRYAAGPASGAMTGAAEGWQVDWPAARRYLQDIASAVENQSEARWLNHYLEQMNVKGSLLRPIMVLHKRYGNLSTQYSTWSMAEGRGLFDAETTLTIRAGPDAGDQAEKSFLLRAQFQATESGTKLETLDLQPLE